MTHSHKGGDGLRLNFIDRHRGKISVWGCIVQSSWFEFLISDKLLPNLFIVPTLGFDIAFYVYF